MFVEKGKATPGVKSKSTTYSELKRREREIEGQEFGQQEEGSPVPGPSKSKSEKEKDKKAKSKEKHSSEKKSKEKSKSDSKKRSLPFEKPSPKKVKKIIVFFVKYHYFKK
jgi:hypothetical protein